MKRENRFERPFGKEDSILKDIHQNYLNAWEYIYKNRPKEGIQEFKNIIDKLAKKSNIKEFKIIIEWFNYVIYFIYFNLEKYGESTYKEPFKEQETIIQKSDYLIWLNKLVYFEQDNIKKADSKFETKEAIQLQFEKYAENPEFYLSKITNSVEVKSSLGAIKETLLNLAQKQIKSPMRNLSIEFEDICKKVLEKREPEIVKSIPQKDYNLGTVLNILNANKYLREETYQRLFNDGRGLRNTIIHINDDEEPTYPESIQRCESLKNGTSELIFDAYFSDMLRNSTDLFLELKKIEQFKFMNDETIKNKILDGWSNGNFEFEPKSNTGEIYSYHGKIKFNSMGNQIEFDISLQHLGFV